MFYAQKNFILCAGLILFMGLMTATMFSQTVSAQTIYNKKPIGDDVISYTKKTPTVLPTVSAPTPLVNAENNLEALAIEQQTSPISPESMPSKNTADHARLITRACANGQWETPDCLVANSSSATQLITGYMESLESKNMPKAVAHIKENCAASTAALKDQTLPAYAMRSAYKTCMDEIANVTDKVNVEPDLSLYQLMGAAVFCMPPKTEAQCGFIEEQLIAKYK